jgi:ParB/RepB/Spo0J family partition protein
MPTQPLEFHQLDRRLEHLRVRHPPRFRRLLASLAETGQQTPVIVIPCGQHYLVIDGHQRIAALQQLRRDTVEAVVWEMGEREALLLVRSLRMNSEPETALEQGWLLQEMESRLDCSIEELARRFDRSATWVARRLALVETLPESVQQQVRQGRIAPQIAMRYLVAVARVSVEQCQRMAEVFAQQHWTTRQAAVLYHAWREARTTQTRERILAAPELFLKTQQRPQPPPSATPATLESDLHQIVAIAQRALQREQTPHNHETIRCEIEHATRLLAQLAARIEPPQEEQKPNHAEPIATGHDPGVARHGDEQAPHRAASEPLAPERAQGAAIELHRRAQDRTGRESRTLPPTDPGVAAHREGQSRASP